MADRKILSNDTVTAPLKQGLATDEEVFTFAQVSETSALTGSATAPLFIAKQNGRIVDLVIGVVAPAVSASGFVSADVSADVKINSVAVCSTQPVIKGPVTSAGAATRKVTNAVSTSAAGNPAPISAVINLASSYFSTGDQVALAYNLNSVGSAAAGTAGAGFYAQVRVRYAAQ